LSTVVLEVNIESRKICCKIHETQAKHICKDDKPELALKSEGAQPRNG
jgi:hypothetical protein